MGMAKVRSRGCCRAASTVVVLVELVEVVEIFLGITISHGLWQPPNPLRGLRSKPDVWDFEAAFPLRETHQLRWEAKPPISSDGFP